MRAGKDALVITCHDGLVHVGMLSQSFLKGQTTVLVPICSFQNGPDGLLSSLMGCDLEAMELNWSYIQNQFQCDQHVICSAAREIGAHGTKVLIWNCTGELETTSDDIECVSKKRAKEAAVFEGGSVKLSSSLRALSEVLYLQRKMKILIMGTRVACPVSSSNKHPFDLLEEKVESYTPTMLREGGEKIELSIGFNRKVDDFGCCYYSGNRCVCSSCISLSACLSLSVYPSVSVSCACTMRRADCGWMQAD